MNTFPPIQEKRASFLPATLSQRCSRGSVTLLTGLLATDGSCNADDAAVNRSRAQACRIRGGYFESDTLTDMLHRVRSQFLHANRDTETSMRMPLVFPPAVPSRLRPEEPQTTPFSRGFRLLKTLHQSGGGGNDVAAAASAAHDGLTTSTNAAPDETASTDGRRPSSVASTTAPREADEETAAGTPISGCGTARWEGAVGAPDSQKWESPALRYFTAASATAPPYSADALTDGALPSAYDAPVPAVHELATAMEQQTHFLDLETCSRQRVAASEAWDRQVVCEMMMAQYVTFVLKPEMEELLAAERAARGVVRFDEEKARYELCQASELAQIVRDGARAARAKVVKLARLERVEAQIGRARGRAHEPSGRCKTDGPDDEDGGDARAILQQYVEMRHGKALRTAAVEETPITAGFTDSPVARPPLPLARTAASFHRAAANAKNRSKGQPNDFTTSQRQSPSDHNPASRRCSGLVLPPVFGANRAVPRRNTLGVANYMSLLDEDSQRRALIVQAEAEQRADVLALARTEWNAVRGWQHKKMHLERLVYWREARERREQEELAALTDVNSEAAVAARAVREAISAAADVLAAGEAEGRSALVEEELAARDTLDGAAQHVALTKAAQRLLDAHRKALGSAMGEIASIQASLITGEGGRRGIEETHRRRIIIARDNWVRDQAASRAEVLLMLYNVSRSEDMCAAVPVLQHAFRRSLQGRLGWRYTHRVVGQEVRELRATKILRTGREHLRELRCTLDQEWAALEAEVRAEHAAAQRALREEEYGRRLALVSQEGWMYSSLCRQFVLEWVAGIIQPRIERCLREEDTVRLQITVEEELRRDQAEQWLAEVVGLVAAKEALVERQRVQRCALVSEEQASFTLLTHAAEDGAEDIRLDERARYLNHLSEREALATCAQDAATELAARLAMTHLDLGLRAQLTLVEAEATDPAWYAALADEEAGNREALHSAYERATECVLYSEMSAQQLLERISLCASVLAEEEATARSTLQQEAASAWSQLVNVDFYDTLSGERIFTHHQQLHAVRVITHYYNATRDHEVGRTATKRYLHDAFAVRRELAELKAIRARQRAHVRSAEQQLDRLLEEERQDAREACQFLIDVLVTRTEPRERTELVESEAFLRQLVFANFFRHTEDGAAAEAEYTVSQHIDRELLMRLEARERGAIAESWDEVFHRYFVQRRAEAVEEAQARTIQRVWRRYRCRCCDRRRQPEHVNTAASAADLLIAEERAVRGELEREELVETAVDVAMPHLMAAAQLTTVQEVMPVVLEGLWTGVHRASIEDEEWSERLDLLWNMRYALCDDVLCSEEAHARQSLVGAEHWSGLEQARLMAEESLERDLLYRERTYFLLRILAKEEQATRRFEIGAEHLKAVAALRGAAAAIRIATPEPAVASTPTTRSIDSARL